MMNNETLCVCRAILPHGAIKEIARRTQLSTQTISTVLTGKRDSPKKMLILEAVANLLAEIKNQKRDALSKLNAALNE